MGKSCLPTNVELKRQIIKKQISKTAYNTSTGRSLGLVFS